MTLPGASPVPSPSLAFKAYEIEELADVYFFRRLGAAVARVARALGLTPTALTFTGGVVGVLAGSLLYDERLGLLAFAILIVHSILDSADGQLARMTGRTSEFGRVLDGVSGYVTFATAYGAICVGVVARGGSPWVWAWALGAGLASAVHAQMYDYHRTSYTSIAITGLPTLQNRDVNAGRLGGVLRLYNRLQQRLVGLHAAVEHATVSRAQKGVASEADRARYRICFYWPVRGWNVLGDNTRIYAIGFFAWIHHLDGFFTFVLGPMNLALLALWFWQRRADRRFLTHV